MVRPSPTIVSELKFVMRGTPPALQIAAENFPQGGVVPSEGGELSRDGHRPSMQLSTGCKIASY